MGDCISRSPAGSFVGEKVYDVKTRNVGLMQAEAGYDVTIVCTSDAQQAAFWKARLEAAKGVTVPKGSTVIAVDEDWPGGAGNFLGTLYAWRKACLAMTALGRDLKAELQKGASVALFHTAGKGTRLAPLPGSENNNKPGVKLPATAGGISILECVIRQTGAYAKSRPGRLSVFWGDQIFVPSVPAEYRPMHHVDIACALGPMPDAEEWARRGNEKYGLIAANADNTVLAMLEKVTHAQATQELAGKAAVERVGTSLGSFSLSGSFLAALEAGFMKELTAKAGKMDTDPHVWMPMTLSEDAYSALAVKKDLFDDKGARAHHQRVAGLIGGFKSDDCPAGMFGAVDVGLDMSWWDFGLLKLYQKNALLLTDSSEDASLARSFFGIAEDKRVSADCKLGECLVDGTSVVSATRATSGSVVASTLADVYTGELRAEEAVLMNVYAKKIIAGKGAVAYNIVDDSAEGVVLKDNEVRVGVFTQSAGMFTTSTSYFEMRSDVAKTDGGQVFKTKVHGNAYSFQEVYDMNAGSDVTACAALAVKRREKFKSSLPS